MKIMYFLAHPDGIGGAAKVLLTQAYIMKQGGNNVLVVIQDNADGGHNLEYDYICAKWNLNNESMIYPIATCLEEVDIIGCFDSYLIVKKSVEKFKPDIIHSIQLNTTVELVARELLIPHVMNIYPMTKEMMNINWIDIWPNYNSSDSIYYCNMWSSALKSHGECIRVAFQGENIQEKSYKENGCYQLVCIGVFSEYKNQLEIIKFIEICIENEIDVKIEFWGDYASEYGKRCIDYVKDNNLSEYITFCGFVSEVSKHLAEKDLLIHASIKESFPGVLVEAMAYSVPILVNPVGGISEILKHKYNAFLSADSSAKSLFQGFELYDAAIKNGEINCIIKNMRNTYRENHTFDVASIKLAHMYNSMINNNKSYIKHVDINELKRILGEFVNLSQTQLSDFTKNRLWYLYFLKQIVNARNIKRVIAWGAGLIGSYACEWCQILNVELVGYIDSFKKGKYMGYPVFEPNESIIKDADIILVALGNYESCKEVCIFLEKMEMTRNDSYFLMQNNPCL